MRKQEEFALKLEKELTEATEKLREFADRFFYARCMLVGLLESLSMPKTESAGDGAAPKTTGPVASGTEPMTRAEKKRYQAAHYEETGKSGLPPVGGSASYTARASTLSSGGESTPAPRLAEPLDNSPGECSAPTPRPELSAPIRAMTLTDWNEEVRMAVEQVCSMLDASEREKHLMAGACLFLTANLAALYPARSTS